MTTEYTTRTVEGRIIYTFNDIDYYEPTMFWHVLIRSLTARNVEVPKHYYDEFDRAFTARLRIMRREETMRAEANGM